MESPSLITTCLHREPAHCQAESLRVCLLSPSPLLCSFPQIPGVPSPAAISSMSPDVPCPGLPETLTQIYIYLSLDWASENRPEAAAHGAAHDWGSLSEFCMAVQSLASRCLAEISSKAIWASPPSEHGWGGGRGHAQDQPVPSRLWNSECQLLTNPLHHTT